MNESKCKIITWKYFLFWKWKSEYDNHDWAYKIGTERDVIRRECLVCHRKEIAWEKWHNSYVWKQEL